MKEQKKVEAITSMAENFSQWYTDVVKKAELCDYSSVKGCMIIRPYAYAIWEEIKANLDRSFKETGHSNVAMPLFIPESLLQKEKDHVEGFAPEVAWITHGGSEKLAERLCVRPTSEVLFCEHYAKIISSWRDLPILYNQWCSVVRWEKSTRPFLRTTEFFWQEGHTAHATKEEAVEETLKILELYRNFYKDVLAIPVVTGLKTEKEKFAGAEQTYTVEAMMHDGKALQAGTSHYFGDGFARAFNIQYSDQDNKLQYVHQTSWGVSTRMIGGLIMVHGDDDGLILPPKVAPWQAVILPIASHKEGILEACQALEAELKDTYRVKLDASNKSAGWKFAEYEMKGVPLRIELGPRDLKSEVCVLCRRDNGEKLTVKISELKEKLGEVLADIHNSMYKKALARLNDQHYAASTWEEFVDLLANKPGFVDAHWCGSLACEERVKEETGASSRCIIEGEVAEDACCLACGQKAKHQLVWAKAY